MKEVNIMRDVYIEKWNIEGDKVALNYSDGTTVHVKKTDFDRAFGTIVNATKAEVERDFAI